MFLKELILTASIFFIFNGCKKEDSPVDSNDGSTYNFFDDQSDHPSTVIQNGITYKLFVNQYYTEDTVSVGSLMPVNFEVTNNSSTKLVLEFKKSDKLHYTIRSSSGGLIVHEPQETGDHNSTIEVNTSTGTTFGFVRSLVDDSRKQIPSGIYKLRIKLDTPDTPILMKSFVIK